MKGCAKLARERWIMLRIEIMRARLVLGRGFVDDCQPKSG